jgi:hypothetical protein
MNFKINETYTKELERTKTSNIPCLWEEVYFEDHIYNVFVITNQKGERIQPLYIKSDSKQTALLPIQTGYYVIYGIHDRFDNTKIYIGQITNIGEKRVEYVIISMIKNNQWDNFITELGRAISAIKVSMFYSDIQKPIYVHNTTITMTSKKYIMSMDCESDGLFGTHVAVAMIIYNHNKKIIDSLYAAMSHPVLINQWAIDNLKFDYKKSDITLVDTRFDLINLSKEFYQKYIKDSVVLTDIPFPVETGFINKLIDCNMDLSPYPIIDLASILISKGYNFNRTRTELYQTLNNGIPLEGQVHDPYYDATLTAEIYFKLMDI